MIEPSLDELLEKTNNLYILVIQAAKRARQLNEEDDSTGDVEERKQYVTQALEEIRDGKVTYEIPKIRRLN